MNITTLLGSIHQHLTVFDLPEPIRLSVASCLVGPVATVQLSGVDLPALAADLLAWADTLDNLSAVAWRPTTPDEDLLHLELRGRLTDDTPVKVFGGLLDGPRLSLAPGARRALSLTLLREWSNFGAVVA